MAIQYNENIKIAAPAPLDKRYLSNRTSFGAQMPYSATTEANTAIILSERYTGLTVNVLGKEYWFKYGVTNSDLIEKKYDSEISNSNFVSGATNIGYFSGYTGIQILEISGTFPMSSLAIPLNFISEYNYYYVDSFGYIRLGSPTHNGTLRRGYVNAARTYSWIYSVYTGGTTGWVYLNVDIATNIGNFATSISYTGSTYTNATWSTPITNGYSMITPTGSLTTGTTYINGAEIYSDKQYQELNFRTIKSLTTDIIKISNDESFVYFSGATDTNKIIHATNGLTKIGQTVKLGGILTGTTALILSGSSSLIFTDLRIIPAGIQYGGNYCANYTARSLVDAAYVTGKTSGGALIKSVYIQPVIATYNVTANDYFIGARSCINSGSTICLPAPSASNCGMVVVIADFSGCAHCYPIQIGGTIVGFPLAQINTCYGSLSFINNGTSWNVIGFSPALA